jgi:hypothetical protein
MKVVNLFGDDWDRRRDRPGWQWNYPSVGNRAGAELFGATLYEIEPGQKSFPYHWRRGTWPVGTFGNDVAKLHGVRARVVGLGALRADKSEVRDDATVAAKDRADVATLSRLG